MNARVNSAVASERERAKEIRELAGRHHLGALGEFHVDQGTSVELFRGIVLNELNARGGEQGSRPLYEPAGHLGLSRRELAKHNLLEYLKSLVEARAAGATGPVGLAKEWSDEIARRAGITARGAFCPLDVYMRDAEVDAPWKGSTFQRTLTASGGVSSGGAVVQSTVAAADYIPPNYNQPMCVRAGARVLPGLQGNVLLPKMSAGKSGTWVNPENTAVTEADPTFAQVSLSPHQVGAVCDISRQLLLQSNPAAAELARADIAVALALAIDEGALTGSGSSGQPTGIFNQSGLGVAAVGANGGAWTWTLATSNLQNVAAANRLIEDGSLGWMMSASAWGHALRTNRVTNGFPEFLIDSKKPFELVNYPVHVTQQIPINLTKGTGTNLTAAIFGLWSDLLIGEWGLLDILVDPFTFSNTGAIRIRAFQTVDVGVRYGAAFSTTNDINTT